MSLAWWTVCRPVAWSNESRGNDDQRQAMTSITAKGLKLLAKMQPEIDAAMGDRLRQLNDDDCRELSRLCGGHSGTPLAGPQQNDP